MRFDSRYPGGLTVLLPILVRLPSKVNCCLIIGRTVGVVITNSVAVRYVTDFVRVPSCELHEWSRSGQHVREE